MQNKGQSTALFIIIIPIIIIILAFVYDNAMIVISTNRYKEVTKTIMKDALTNSYNDKVFAVKSLYEKNKYEVDKLNVTYEEGVLTVYNIHSFDSIFASILGNKKYRMEVYYEAYIQNNEVIIKEIEKE